MRIFPDLSPIRLNFINLTTIFIYCLLNWNKVLKTYTCHLFVVNHSFTQHKIAGIMKEYNNRIATHSRNGRFDVSFENVWFCELIAYVRGMCFKYLDFSTWETSPCYDKKNFLALGYSDRNPEKMYIQIARKFAYGAMPHVSLSHETARKMWSLCIKPCFLFNWSYNIVTVK